MPIEKRVTVNLTRRGAQAVEALAARNAESLTDTINRALALLDFVDGRIAAGDELTMRAADGTLTKVVLL